MPRPAKLADLPRTQWNHWQEVFDRFEQAWREADTVDLGAFLPPAGDEVRPLVLQELIRTELEARWRRGRGPLLEEYLQKFPELAEDPRLWPPLLFEEYRVRRHYGDRPEPAVYRERFPEQFAELERLLREQDGPPPGSSTVRPGVGTIPPAEARPTRPVPPPPPPPPAAAGALGMVSRDMVLPGGGGFKLLERLGSGQFGEVWRAEAPGGVEVAVKVIFRPLQHDDAQREQEALEVVKRLRHPFLVQLHQSYQMEDRLLIVMELGDGNLRGRLKECRKAGQQGIPPAELLVYLREACEALDFLHERRVLHRDIKPDNIVLFQRHAKLADMGLARMLEAQRSFTATTCGSPPYMAPEVWVQHACAGSDQYSLAASYCELRLGRMLFPGGDWIQLMLAHREGKPDLEGLPEAEQAVLRRALAKEPAERFPTCLDFYRDLQDVVTPPRAQTATHQDRLPAPAPRSDGEKTPWLSDLAGSALPPPASDPAPTLSPSAAAPAAPAPRPKWRAEPASRVGQLLLWVAVGLVPLLLGGGILYWASFGPGGTAPGAEPRLPAGWAKEEGAKVERIGDGLYYTRIAYRLRDGTPVRFRLLLSPPDLPPFYLMETKVSNRMFAQYAEEQHPPPEPAWKKGGRWKKGDVGIEGDAFDYPVYRVTWDTAHDFARWLGGDLPTAQQWDWAAGRFVDPRPDGPFEGAAKKVRPEDFALRNTGPRPVGRSPADASIYHGQDMASNGLEWTRTVAGPPGPDHLPDESKTVPPGPSRDISISLRGASYTDSEPFTFADLEKGRVEARERYRDPDVLSDVSFRVVLPVPPGPVGKGS